MGWANWCEGWADYQIDCTTTAVGEVIEEWESEQRLKWASSWKLEALAACHGVVCEGSNLILLGTAPSPSPLATHEALLLGAPCVPTPLNLRPMRPPAPRAVWHTDLP